jgi:DNA repair protein RadC
MELGRRRQISDVLNRKTVTNSADAADVFMAELSDLNHERFMVMYLNTANKILDWEKISDGGLASTIADIRIILKKALLKNAPRIIIAHNHPSGDPTPSEEDKKVTKQISMAASTLGIKLLDHIIVARRGYFSFQESGLL